MHLIYVLVHPELKRKAYQFYQCKKKKKKKLVWSSAKYPQQINYDVKSWVKMKMC